MALTDPSELPVLTINLEYGDTGDSACLQSPRELFQQFTGPNKSYPEFGFMEVNAAVLVIPDNVEDWWGAPESKLMRYNVRRAVKLGYEFRPFDFNDYIDDIFEINTSLEQRQGRAMSESYRTRPGERSPFASQPCPRHRYDYFGVFKDGKLYGYALVPQCGEMLVFSTILGHGAHMDDGVMWLLVAEVAKHNKANSGTRYAVYYLMDSGTQGLQFFKRKMGFAAYRVRWELARPGVEVPAELLLPAKRAPIRPSIMSRVKAKVAARLSGK